MGRIDFESRLANVLARIEAAALRAGRSTDEITLVAVSKTHTAQEVLSACEAGLRHFGENRVEEAGPKIAEVARLLAGNLPEWHMIGHVQSRKAADVLPWAALVHSVDSLKLAERLNRLCDEASHHLPILLEVNVAGEASKYGIEPAELPAIVDAVEKLAWLKLRGLMTMAPICADPESTRPVFASLRRLRDELQASRPGGRLDQLSMGMTDDFEIAIEEGATIVRIGRALFGDTKQH